jgi:galactofuranose transport system substrate-binding protein
VFGYAQSEAVANPFRQIETDSMTNAAKSLGFQLKQTNGNSDIQKENQDVQDLVTQGVQFLVLSPLDVKGLEGGVSAARAKNIPVLTIDRHVAGTVCKDYIAWIGSDFFQQGERAAIQMAKALNNKGNIIELLGAPGNDTATARQKGFDEELAKIAPGIKILAEQTGNFNRQDGQTAAAALLQAHPNVQGIYAHNDEMAFGAINALKALGKVAGKDVQIVSIDGIPDALTAVKDGTFFADIETNPKFGPLAFTTAQAFLAGKPVPEEVIIKDHLFTKDQPAGTFDDIAQIK